MNRRGSMEDDDYFDGPPNPFGDDAFPKIVIGSKIDLESQREVSIDQATLFCNSLGLDYFEAKACTKRLPQSA